MSARLGGALFLALIRTAGLQYVMGANWIAALMTVARVAMEDNFIIDDIVGELLVFITASLDAQES